jgi:mRNA interferase HicA
LDRRELIRHLEDHGCEFVREGGNHTIYRNPATGRIRSILRHREVSRTPPHARSAKVLE